MPGPFAAPMNWDQLVEDRNRALEQTPARRSSDEEQLPAYAEATQGQSPANITEKEVTQEQSKPEKSGKMATLKSILTLGDVQRHNPRYTLEESMTGQQSTARAPPKPSNSNSSSTLKSILTGQSPIDSSYPPNDKD
jgi:hypothetical protein